ncbi:cytochrome P450 [Syncephalis pseudoplumigaleata]|uniref:Cytochrome P450 n=1 Tax=Syncephalis pseudoplumigaleata TaxID=1712513 RepID=A0A4P9Z3Y8_9FUNG|nr:cytochrome P450 [Syncephalis pseudoplumigaleata]|eukprot:RKP27145.1 cytochrome P450 [Syncephalis pseudoplumigaleata]
MLAFYDTLLAIAWNWPWMIVAGGACLFIKILADELWSPIARVPGVRPALLARLLTLYHMATGSFTAYTVSMSRRYGKLYRLSSNAVATTDVDAIRLIYSSTRFKKPECYRYFAFHRDSLLSTRDIEHHRRLLLLSQKRLVGPVFSTTSITELEPLVYRAGAAAMAKRVAQYADAGQPFDAMALSRLATLDVIGEVAFGGSFESLAMAQDEGSHPVFRWMNDMTHLGVLKQVFGRLCQPWIMPRHFASERMLVEFTRSVVQGRMAAIASDHPTTRDHAAKDVLQRLIEAVDPATGDRLDVDQIIAESIVQLTLHLLMEHPDVYHRLERELLAAIPDRDQAISHATVRHLPLLNAVLYESMRLRPVGSASQRVVPSGGMVIAGVYLPPGLVVHPITSGVHLLPEIFGDDAECFRPDRWLAATPEQLRGMRQCLLTFSLGARACIGRSLAWMELRLMLSVLVRRFVLSIPPCTKTDMTPVQRFGLKPRGGRLDVLAVHRTK